VRLRRRLHPLQLLPFRLLVITMLVATCFAVGRISQPAAATALSAHVPAAVPVADVIQPSWLRTLPARRAGDLVVVAAQLVTQLPQPTEMFAKPRAAVVPVSAAPVVFTWRWHARSHTRVITTGAAGWASMRLARVNRALVVHAEFAGARSYAASTPTQVTVPAPRVTRSLARHPLSARSTSGAVPRPAGHYPPAAFVFPFLHPGSAEPPGTWSLDQGVDMFAYGQACGSAAVLVAVGNGVVIQEGISGFGPTAPVLRMTSGPFVGRNVYYGHTGRVFVPVGASVRAGQPIAEIGCGQVGYSAAPHLEIGVGLPGGPPCCPAMGQTSHEIYRVLAAAY
jgi:murein DD-endopeptidase MepM/ murein hydrolase activator NlpD